MQPVPGRLPAATDQELVGRLRQGLDEKVRLITGTLEPAYDLEPRVTEVVDLREFIKAS